MCGIVGMVNGHPVARDLVTALGRLEYRGYDSAGLAVAGPGFDIRKVVGGIPGLMDSIGNGFAGRAGIGHTRWATHGRAELRNAHPHVWNGVAVVHNGIIENYRSLRSGMLERGETFQSETDSEVIPHLIAAARAAGAAPVEAVRGACAELQGDYAIAVLFEDAPDRVIVARQGSPVMVARGPQTAAVASDPAALASVCDDYATLEDGDLAELSTEGVTIYDSDGCLTRRRWQKVEGAEDDGRALVYGSFTRAEIAAQPEALRRTDAKLRDRVIPLHIAEAERLLLVGCGSSLHAAAAARPWLECLIGIPCDLEAASECRTREAPLSRGTVGVLVSQSGETADILAVMEMLKPRNVPLVAVVNVPHAQLARGADLSWPTEAGREQGVAATKSFTCQMLALIRFGLAMGLHRGTVTLDTMVAVERELNGVAAVCARAEKLDLQFEAIAERLVQEGEALFIGRGSAAAMAAEGALKLKELPYLRAEAYAAGELKYGAIATVHEGSPVIVCAGAGQYANRTLANAEEVRARGAYVIALVDDASAAAFAPVADELVVLPGAGLGTLFAQAVAIQLIAVHAAILLNHPVDRPRHQAKSVTVA
nr:glutamine--fructose-6-phosphate transaminase (isomerizing) [uncultured Rhodopila sp.]